MKMIISLFYSVDDNDNKSVFIWQGENAGWFNRRHGLIRSQKSDLTVSPGM
jgi:hypothetical protein